MGRSSQVSKVGTRRAMDLAIDSPSSKASAKGASQMKRVYGLRDNTTEHSEYKRLAEQLMRPEWAQLRGEWKWAVTEKRAYGQKTGWRALDRVLKVKVARKAPTCYGGGTEEEGHGWEYVTSASGKASSGTPGCGMTRWRA